MADYKIKPGDTLYGISKTTGIPVDSLLKYNNLSRDAILKIGANLKLSSDDSEITANRDITDTSIQRDKYLTTTGNSDYVVKSGDTLEKIAKYFGVEAVSIAQVNSIDIAATLKIGQSLKIPPTRTVKNINNINDVAKALGVSEDFIQNLKQIEDGEKNNGVTYKANEFHNTPYIDKTGNKTIGIGHVVKRGEKEYLSDKEVLETFAKDLLKAEEHLWVKLGKQRYDSLSQPIKESLLDMVFNKGSSIITTDIIKAVKSNDYEEVINCMTNIKSNNGQELCGLCKRRLFDIATACKIYDENIPKSNISTAQKIYDTGVKLLRAEYKSHDFNNLIAGYNNYVQKYFDDKIILTLQ